VLNDIPVTEQDNPRSAQIDSMSIAEVVALINAEDLGVAEAVRRELTHVTRAIEGIVDRMRRGGRLIYVGTGTSGRLGVLDASECPPTYGVSPDLVQGIIAGGYDACHRAVEASEDDGEAGVADLAARDVSERDAVVGLTASGRTPYTIGAVRHARSVGAFTVAITCVPASAITRECDVPIVPVVGPEVVSGSTRMKAGTAQKLVLNMISTTALIQLGYVRGNRMSNMRARNTKLQARAVGILRSDTSLDEQAAHAALADAGGDVATALVMVKTRRSCTEAQAALQAAGGIISAALTILQAQGETS